MTSSIDFEKVHDLVIVGGGPAGLSAAIYASRAMLDTITVEQTAIGGQVILTTDIDNYPGVPNTTGFELVDAMQRQATDLGAQFVTDTVQAIDRDAETGVFSVKLSKETLKAKAVILATGATPRHAGFDGEDGFYGHGVSYCATCDGMFYRGKEVFVVGGGNSALDEALFLTRFASKVTLVVRKDHVRAHRATLEQAEANEKINFRYLTSITKLEGGALPSKVTFRNNETGEETVEELPEGSFGVFVFVGHIPASTLLEGMATITDAGTVITDAHMATDTPGLFCAGDVRETPLRQIVTAAADGAIAATSAASFLGQPIEG